MGLFKKKVKSEISKDMTIANVLKMRKTAPEVLMGFGMHCIYCPHHQMETLEEAAVVHGIDVELLVQKLNEAK